MVRSAGADGRRADGPAHVLRVSARWQPWAAVAFPIGCCQSPVAARRAERQGRNGASPARIQSGRRIQARSEEHTSELQSLMRISYAVFCLKKKKKQNKKSTKTKSKSKHKHSKILQYNNQLNNNNTLTTQQDNIYQKNT